MKHIILLLKRQWLENRKTWLIGCLSIASLLSFLFLIIWHWRTSFNGDTLKGVFMLMLLGGGGIFISSIFKDLGNKQKGIWFLILPASASEKLVVALFYGIPIYLAAYLGIFYTTKEIAEWILGKDAVLFNSFDIFKNNFHYFIFTFINFQSIILLGSVYFNKSQFLKTILVLIVGMFLLFNGNDLFLKAITNESMISSSFPLGGFQFIHQGENVYVHSPDNVQTAVSILLHLVVPIALWIITWFRIKEKQL